MIIIHAELMRSIVVSWIGESSECERDASVSLLSMMMFLSNGQRAGDTGMEFKRAQFEEKLIIQFSGRGWVLDSHFILRLHAIAHFISSLSLSITPLRIVLLSIEPFKSQTQYFTQFAGLRIHFWRRIKLISLIGFPFIACSDSFASDCALSISFEMRHI